MAPLPHSTRLSASKERRSDCAARAQRRANGQFRLAAHRAGQHEIGDVRAGDDEQQPGSREQHPQNGVGARVDLVVHARDADLVVVLGLVDLRMRPRHGAIHGVQLGARRFERGAGSQPREDLGHAVLAAGDHGGRKMMRAGDHVGDDFSGDGIRNRRLEHADDGRRARPAWQLSRRTVLPSTLGSECSESRQNL